MLICRRETVKMTTHMCTYTQIIFTIADTFIVKHTFGLMFWALDRCTISQFPVADPTLS